MKQWTLPLPPSGVLFPVEIKDWEYSSEDDIQNNPFLSITLQRHPCSLGRQNYFNKDGCGLGFRVEEKDLG